MSIHVSVPRFVATLNEIDKRHKNLWLQWSGQEKMPTTTVKEETCVNVATLWISPEKANICFLCVLVCFFGFFCIATMKNCGDVREHITNRVSIFIIETVLLIGRRRLWYCELYKAASNLSAHKGVLLRISFHLWKSIHKNEQKIFVCDNFIFCT